jgi:hypothetical protein
LISKSEAIEIANEIISVSFPELKSTKIKYRFVSGKKYDYYMAAAVLFSQYEIFIQKEILSFSKEAFKGCLATELAHLVIDSKKSVFQLIGEKLSKSKLTIEERKADDLAIERGFGPALLQFHKEHEKEYESYNSSEGLTKREVQLKIKSRKK